MIPSFIDQDFLMKAGAIGAAMAWEYWLGKTDKTKSGSTLELIERVVAGILKAIFNKTPKPGEKV